MAGAGALWRTIEGGNVVRRFLNKACKLTFALEAVSTHHGLM